jgi:predicted nuclease of predicted toxin-antitoxin system
VRAARERRVEALTVFLDRNLGHRVIAQAMRDAGVVVHIHDDLFPQDAKDEEWLPVVGHQGWIVLTKDARIRYRPQERAALLHAQVRAFVLVGKNLSGPALADICVKALPAIRRFVARYDPPFIARISRSGAVDLLTGS